MKQFYVFGPFRFDAEERTLQRDGSRVPLAPKVAETLLILVQQSGRLVDKGELMKAVWPETFVEEGNLNKNVFVLRKILGQWDGGREYIETVPKRGYRFASCVSQLTEQEPTLQGPALQQFDSRTFSGKSRWWYLWGTAVVLMVALAAWGAWHRHLAAEIPAIHSLAVLPLENLSSDASQGFFADAMTEELTTDLGQISNVRVISRTSAMQYKGARKPLSKIARELNVDAIVEGAVVRSGDKVRITAQLIYAPTDKHLWAQSYEGDLTDLLGLQRNVAIAIASHIQSTLGSQRYIPSSIPQSLNPEAYEAYLKGFSQPHTTDGLQRSVLYFQEATGKQPDYALAYVGLAKAYVNLGHMLVLPPQDAFPKAGAAAARALQVDDSLADAHTAAANVKFLYEWDFSFAEKEFGRALELNPNSLHANISYVDFLSAMGRHDEAIDRSTRLREIDPMSLAAMNELTESFYFARRYDDAIAQARKVLAVDPNYPLAHLWLGLALEQQRTFPSAIAEIQKAVQLSNNKAWIGFVAHALALSGDKDGAHRMLAGLEASAKQVYISPWWFAMIYPDLGDNERALAELDKCYQGREHDLTFSAVWPMFDKLRPDPRYRDLMRRIGFPASSVP